MVIANLVTWVPFIVGYFWEFIGEIISGSEEAPWSLWALGVLIPILVVVLGLVNGLLMGQKNNPKNFTRLAYFFITLGVVWNLAFFGYIIVENIQMRARISDNAQCKQRCQAQKYELGNIGKDGKCHCNSYRP